MADKSLHSLARTFAAGTVLFEEGTAGGGMVILLAGRLGVYREGKKVGSITEPGSYVGESSVITGSDRTATVKAESSVTIVKLTAEQAQNFLGTRTAKRKMVKNIADRLETVNGRLVDLQQRVEVQKDAMGEVLTLMRQLYFELEAVETRPEVSEARRKLRLAINKFGTGRYTKKRIQA